MEIILNSETINLAHIDICNWKDTLGETIIGQPGLINAMVCARLGGGHILLESQPGLGKTLSAKAMANVVGGTFGRVQGAPDLMPSDYTGSIIYNQETGKMETVLGPLYNSVFLADEVNRSPGRAQAGMLEAMAEGQITIGGESYLMMPGFFFIATQNPQEHEGTYELTEAVKDRFLYSYYIDYPDRESERLIAKGRFIPPEEIKPVFDIDRLLELQEMRRAIAQRASDEVTDLALDIVEGTRKENDFFRNKAGTRCVRDMLQIAAATALCDHRITIERQDVLDAAQGVLQHRLTPENFEMETRDVLPEYLAQFN